MKSKLLVRSVAKITRLTFDVSWHWRIIQLYQAESKALISHPVEMFCLFQYGIQVWALQLAAYNLCTTP